MFIKKIRFSACDLFPKAIFRVSFTLVAAARNIDPDRINNITKNYTSATMMNLRSLFSFRHPLFFRVGPFSDRMNTEGAFHSAAKEEARYTRLPQMETLIAAVHSPTHECPQR